jgi:hypothetical protein
VANPNGSPELPGSPGVLRNHLTEDLQHDGEFEGLQVVNPFRVTAGSLR